MAHLYCAWKITIPRHIRHVAWLLYKVLRDKEKAYIKWPLRTKRRVQEGLVYAFLKAVAFVDGSKMRTFRPSNQFTQADIYCGYHHFHCFSTLVWTYVFGFIIRLNMTLKGSDNDRSIYNRCAPYRVQNRFLCNTHIAISHTGFQGHCRHLVFHLKKTAAIVEREEAS